MSYDNRTRDRYRDLVTGVTGVAGVGALTVTGALMGLAADDTPDEQPAVTGQNAQAAQKQRAHRRTEQPGPQLRQRPYVTRVTIRYVTGAGTAQPGPGGAVAPAASGGSTGSTGAAPPPAPPAAPPATPAPAPAPPPPAAEPAPSSGS